MSAARRILRLEGAALATISAGVAWQSGPPMWLVPLVLLAPDLAFAAYLIGPRAGAWAYNLAHSTIGPILVAGAGLVLADRTTVEVALLWLVHVGADRAFGFGLKGASFRDTHLGPLG